MEQAKISIVELLTISQNESVIVDGIFHCDILEKVSSTNRVVFLMADMQAIRATASSSPLKLSFDVERGNRLRCKPGATGATIQAAIR